MVTTTEAKSVLQLLHGKVEQALSGKGLPANEISLCVDLLLLRLEEVSITDYSLYIQVLHESDRVQVDSRTPLVGAGFTVVSADLLSKLLVIGDDKKMAAITKLQANRMKGIAQFHPQLVSLVEDLSVGGRA